MSTSDLLALYGAILATAIAVAQVFTWWRKRVSVEAHLRIVTRTISEEEIETVKGTPVRVQRGQDELWGEMLVEFEVRNTGGTPVQIVAVVLELLQPNSLQSFEVAPNPLPTVLEPATRVEFTIQKEFIDSGTSILFLGVVDALGRRYSPYDKDVSRVIRASWGAPTRVKTYRRRDDSEAEPVTAFQMKDRASMRQAPLPRKRRKAIAERLEGSY